MITQKDLLNEGFWSKFGNVAKGVGAVAKEVGKSVLPQTAKALGDTKDYLRNLSDKFKMASNEVKEVKDFVIDRGYFPITEIKPHPAKYKGKTVYAFNVSALDYSDKGEPIPGRSYNYPRIIIQKDDNNQLKVLDPPRDRIASRIHATSSKNNSNNSQQQSGTKQTP